MNVLSEKILIYAGVTRTPSFLLFAEYNRDSENGEVRFRGGVADAAAQQRENSVLIIRKSQSL